MTKYYTLFVFDTDQNLWFEEFGDYDRETVDFEVEELRHGFRSVPKKHIKIVRTGDHQDEIEAARFKLNEETRRAAWSAQAKVNLGL